MKLKQIIVIISFVIIILKSFGQEPKWTWIKTSNICKSGSEGNKITVDSKGNTYTLGDFVGSPIILDTLIINKNSGIFISKVSSTGKVLWLKSPNGNGLIWATGITTDLYGNIYISGCFNGDSIEFGNIKLNITDSFGYMNIFIVKYDSAGNALWVKNTIGNYDDIGINIYTDYLSNVYLIGNFQSSSIVLDKDTLSNSGETNIFIAKYDQLGNIIWAKKAGGNAIDGGLGINIDFSGNIYITGWFTSQIINFDSISLLNSGFSNVFIAKYSTSGRVIWAKSSTGIGIGDEGIGLKTDNKGNVYLIGNYTSPLLSFDNIKLYNVTGNDSTEDIFLVKLNSDGKIIWAKSAGGVNVDMVSDIAIDQKENIYITGTYQSSIINFDSFSLFNNTSCNIFIVKYNTNGKVIYVKSAGDFTNCISQGLAIDSFNNLYITGSLWGDTSIFDNINIIKNVRRYCFFIGKLSSNSDGIEYPNSNLDSPIIIYPNPSHGKLKVIIPYNTQKIQVFNSSGKLLFAEPVKEKTQLNFDLNLVGVNYIRIITGYQSYTRKIIIYR